LPLVLPWLREPPRWVQTSCRQWTLPASSRNSTKSCPSRRTWVGFSRVTFPLSSIAYQKLMYMAHSCDHATHSRTDDLRVIKQLIFTLPLYQLSGPYLTYLHIFTTNGA